MKLKTWKAFAFGDVPEAIRRKIESLGSAFRLVDGGVEFRRFDDYEIGAFSRDHAAGEISDQTANGFFALHPDILPAVLDAVGSLDGWLLSCGAGEGETVLIDHGERSGFGAAISKATEAARSNGKGIANVKYDGNPVRVFYAAEMPDGVRAVLVAVFDHDEQAYDDYRVGDFVGGRGVPPAGEGPGILDACRSLDAYFNSKGVADGEMILIDNYWTSKD